jgi:hypothetical protein
MATRRFVVALMVRPAGTASCEDGHACTLGVGMSGLFSFPNPVNEKAARFVAAVVALASAVTLVSGWYWLLVPIAYGFVARVLTGPTLSPLGRFAMTVAAPRLGPPVYVPGPPKRFAQGIGAVCTVAAAVFALVLGWTTAAAVILAMMVVFATLEAGFALCVGCKIFALLMAAGVVPQSACAACADGALNR